MFKWRRKKDLTIDDRKVDSIDKKKILIVDDNDLNVTLFTDLLEAHGYETCQIGEGLKVIGLAREFQPDLILMDLQLPDESGLEVTKWIKQDKALKSIPVVAVTAFALKGDEKRMEEAGCLAFIAKPITVSSFLETVSQILEGKWSKQANTSSKRPTQRKRKTRRNSKIESFRLNNEQLELVRDLWIEGKSGREISETTGLQNRNFIMGEIWRMGLSNRSRKGFGERELSPKKARTKKR